MSTPSNAVHGQWRVIKFEVDNGSIYLTELMHPVLYSKEYIRGRAIAEDILKEYKRKLH